MVQIRPSLTYLHLDVSTDGGVTWVTKEGPYGYSIDPIRAASDGTAIIAAGYMIYDPSYISLDAGDSWPTEIPALGWGGGGAAGWGGIAGHDGVFVVQIDRDADSTTAAEVDPVTSDVIYSTDHGDTWHNSDLSVPSVYSANDIGWTENQFVAHFLDEFGSDVYAYSLDGQHWVYVPCDSDIQGFWTSKVGCVEK